MSNTRYWDELMVKNVTLAKEALAACVGIEVLVGRSASTQDTLIRVVLPDGSREPIVVSGVSLDVHVPPSERRGLTVHHQDGTQTRWDEPFNVESPHLCWKPTDGGPPVPGTLAV